MAPQVTVVTPEECQSKPRTQPKAWNHQGSESRRSISAGPYSSTTAMGKAPASFHMREKSQGGAEPVWRGSWARRRCTDYIIVAADGVVSAVGAGKTEEVGFEPTGPLRAHRFSRPAHSTTLPLLRECFGIAGGSRGN